MTDPSTLPTSGSATYDGLVDMSAAGEAETFFETMTGEVSGLDVGFGDDTVTGTATNFVTSDEERLAGEVTFGGGFVDRAVEPNGGGWTFGASDTGGLLTDEGGSQHVVSNGVLRGDFVGADRGLAGGTVDFDMDSLANGDHIDLQGDFAVRLED